MHGYKGKFIVLEGGEGVGKSTLSRSLQTHFQNNLDKKVLVTREPGGSFWGEEVRKLLLFKSKEVDPMAQLVAFFAARFDHLIQVIIPNLEEGNIVITDRYYFSSYAYQVEGPEDVMDKPEIVTRMQRRDLFMHLKDACDNLLTPDMILFLRCTRDNVPVMVNRARIEAGKDVTDFDLKGYDYHHRVLDAMQTAFDNHTLVKNLPGAPIDVDLLTKEQVFECALGALASVVE